MSVYNDIEFKVEDAIKSLLDGIADQLYSAPVVVSLLIDELETSHVAVIVESLDVAEGVKESGNWTTAARIKTVTSIDETITDEMIAAGVADIRALHRLRCGLVRDTLMVENLDTLLGDATTDLTIQGNQFSKASQRIVGRSWISEFTITFYQVSGSDL